MANKSASSAASANVNLRVDFVLALFTLPTKIYGHCQVPCGIYDDAVRIVQVEEDITTKRKY